MPHAENCRDLLDSLSDYIDGSLGDELCLEIERHLADCENCRIVIDTLRKTVYLYRATAAPPAIPDDVRQRLFHRLDLESFSGQTNPGG
ncbi:MAG TPA: anti-sigma factor [Anaerolineales bacterium]